VTMRSWIQVLETTSYRNTGKGCISRIYVVGPFPEPCASRIYVHQAAL
jgi:hypothetical protein